MTIREICSNGGTELTLEEGVQETVCPSCWLSFEVDFSYASSADKETPTTDTGPVKKRDRDAVITASIRVGFGQPLTTDSPPNTETVVPKPEADASRILSEIKHTNVAPGKKLDNLKIATPVTADVLESVTRKKR